MLNEFHVGVDPDLHNTAFAVLQNGKPYRVWVESIDRKIKGLEAVAEMVNALACSAEYLAGFRNAGTVVAVEAQRVYARHQDANPNSLILLANVAGVAAGLVAAEGLDVGFVYPQDWKGQQPKKVNQARTFEAVGWDYQVRDLRSGEGYCVPKDSPFALSAGEWKHAGDALGIALWAYQDELKRVKRQMAKDAAKAEASRG